MKVAVKTLDNKSAGEIELDRGGVRPARAQDILARMVRWQLAKRRQARTTPRRSARSPAAAASRGTQKGTGRARQGSTRSPQWRKGAVIFGPTPRSHAHRSAEEGPQARRSRRRCRPSRPKGKLIVLEGGRVDEAKTKELAQALRQARLVVGAGDRRRRRSTRSSPRRRATSPASTCCRSRAPTSTTSCAATRWC